jgi:hypothetical protein
MHSVRGHVHMAQQFRPRKLNATHHFLWNATVSDGFRMIFIAHKHVL